MILTPLIDIDNLDPTNGIIYIFEPLWSLMTKGERMVYKDSENITKGESNKDISDRGRTWNKQEIEIWQKKGIN